MSRVVLLVQKRDRLAVAHWWSHVDIKILIDKAKIAISEFAYSSLRYKNALGTKQRKYPQSQEVLSSRLKNLINLPPLKMQKSDNIIIFSEPTSCPAAVF